MVRSLAVAIMVAAVGGCAIADTDWRGPMRLRFAGDPSLSRCVDALAEIRRGVVEAGTGDAETAPIAGFPYLRINRFLARVGDQFDRMPADTPAFEAWVAHLRALDARATRIELANMPGDDRLRLELSLGRVTPTPVDVEVLAESCGDRLWARDLADAGRRRQLPELAQVPDQYSNLARIAGFYPLTSIAASHGWEAWKDANFGSFLEPPASLPVEGTIVDWVPDTDVELLSPPDVATIVESSRDPRLGIPEPKGKDLRSLIATFAPVWRVDVTGAHDRIGTPTWPAGGDRVEIDTGRPTTFTHVGHAFFGGQILLQVSYGVWFTERPHESELDILAGHLDGIIWRVTIGADGRPLVYDTIHPCGCYHLFFPSPPLRRRPVADDMVFDEIADVPVPAPRLEDGQRMVLWLATRSHYLVGLSTIDDGEIDGSRYVFADDNDLRSLPIPGGGRRSLFEADGLVAGTERMERFLLWPMGIASPGAMRQWGTHATAFVGRRHFDAPDLIEKAFER
jgi:hypothetical protein